jgi:signal transduction histidine kinase/ligand-binding sensor domain-containing protein/DNA-binding response OmpR family regulator
MNLKFLFVGFLLVLEVGGCMLLAQTHHYRFTRLDVNQGLSHNQVKTVLKDKEGFIWFGTNSGLNRYDGYTLKVFRNQPGDTSSIISSEINKIFEGPEGKIWINTWSGANVYNPDTELFERNVNRLLRRYGIPEGSINDIKKDSKGNFWFVHATLGLFIYNETSKQTEKLAHSEDRHSLLTNRIAAWAEDPKGNIWIIHSNGVLQSIDPVTRQVIYSNESLAGQFRQRAFEYALLTDADGDLWLYVPNSNLGVFYFDTSKKQWQHFDNTPTSRVRLNTDIIRGIVQDSEGLIWIATDHGGINLIDKHDFSVDYILHNKEDEKSLGQNSINVLYKDKDDMIWAGTFKRGVSFYHPKINRFQLYRQQISDPGSLPFNDINCFAEDDKQNLWIGTNGGGLIYYDRKTNTYKQYLHDPRNPQSLSTNVIVTLFIDRDEKLWIGTYFGGLNSFDGKKFTRYRHNPEDPASLGDDSIWEIFEDSQRNLWIGTLTQGMDLFDRRKQEFYHYKTGAINSVHATYIPAFMEDRQGNLWVGTGYGIDFLEKQSGRFTQYLNQGNDPFSLSNNSVLSIVQDSRDFIWIATHGGLNLFDSRTRKFRAFTERDGLPHNSILTILEDDNRNLWLTTPHGISNVHVRYTPGTPDSLSLSFKNYDESDGLQGKQFNENAAFKTSKGELVVGGANGFNLFKPESIGVNTKEPTVILTDLEIFNKRVAIGEDINGKTVLTQPIHKTQSIVLDHSDNVFSLEFAALSHFHPEKSRYQYMMEGFDKVWVRTDAGHRRVTYTNLDPGSYIFKVKASNNDGIWNDVPTTLKITVLPPFWKTKTAFVLYALAVLASLLLARWLILSNERMNFRIQQEREEAHRMHELDMMKIRFFTNVSHEFRTPLTLILTPLEKMLKHGPEGEQQNQMQLIYRNARRLLNLVNQLLDFRKMEVQDIKLNPSEGDIIKFIREVFYSFSDLSEKKNIRFTFQSSIPQMETLFDQDKLEKILFNLLSNAFKFTRDNGFVAVEVNCKPSETQQWLEIKVSDNGIGIPADKQEKIFERFFQNDLPKSVVNQGSGIGLSITREFVKIHGGSIIVESEPEKGSCFTVLLPLPELTSVGAEERMEPELLLPLETIHTASIDHHGKKPVLLLVEDNEDFRFYLKDNLKLQYTILEAKNGNEGLERALASMPDLIVSDIMMPEMNGIELCKRIRNDQRTSHIPVVLLTARTAEEQKMEGFESGANDYVTKPFNFEILQSRLKNLIAQRDAFQKMFHKHIDVKAGDVHITSLDEKLITNAVKVVEDNLGDPDFSVEDFSHKLGMSRVHLYKKLLSLTGKSPIEFIRIIRLQRAAQLLEKSQLTVSEIAYQVGFNNPKYFSKYFKDQFNVLPSAYANGKK